eukprot:166179-Hanusia_phi.AAC.8
MVVVKKPGYPNPQQAAMGKGPTLDRPYVPHMLNDEEWNQLEDDTINSIFGFQSTMKRINGWVGIMFYGVAIFLAGWTLNKSFTSSKFPTSVVTHAITPWNRLNKLDDTLKMLDGTQGSLQANVDKIWTWAGCDKYITTGRVPLQTDKNTIAVVSSSNPVYMPGGCNCLAQVGHAISANWSYSQTTSPTKDEVKDMIRFCTYEADMPPDFEPRKAVYRPLFFFYAFIFVATGGIVIANYMHDGAAGMTKALLQTMPEDEKAKEAALAQFRGQREMQIGYLVNKASAEFLVIGCTVVSFTFAFLYSCNSCDAGLSEFNLGFPITYLVFTFLIGFIFILPYLYARKIKSMNLYDALYTVVNREHDQFTLHHFNRDDRDKFFISDALNAQAQLEQLWTDILSIPAFVMLSVGITLTREWTDEGALFYNALLVFIYMALGTAGNWVTCHWTRALRVDEALGKEGTSIYNFYQGYKDMITYAQIFALIALVFTAMPSSSITPYSYILFYNWFYFIIGLFLVSLFPDILNDRVGLTMHTVTAWKQLCMLFVSFTLLLTIASSEWLGADLLAYTYITG